MSVLVRDQLVSAIVFFPWQGICPAYPIGSQAQERISEAPRGQLAMNLRATVLRQRISELKN